MSGFANAVTSIAVLIRKDIVGKQDIKVHYKYVLVFHKCSKLCCNVDGDKISKRSLLWKKYIEWIPLQVWMVLLLPSLLRYFAMAKIITLFQDLKVWTLQKYTLCNVVFLILSFFSLSLSPPLIFLPLSLFSLFRSFSRATQKKKKKCYGKVFTPHDPSLCLFVFYSFAIYWKPNATYFLSISLSRSPTHKHTLSLSLSPRKHTHKRTCKYTNTLS